jgi:arylsulfatase A-like enzyme
MNSPLLPSLGVLSLAVASAAFAQSAAPRKPNVLLFYADDLGYRELACYGSPEFRTPHIDSIAKNGIRFTSGYVSAPLCSPSRAGLMTGRYQTRFGHENNTMAPEGHLPFTETTLANRMKTLGYATGMTGKWHLGNTPTTLPTARGFDDYYGVMGNPGSYLKPHGLIDSRLGTAPQTAPAGFYTTDAFGDWAVDWIGRHKDGPWFLYMPFNAIHGPHEATEKYLGRFAHIADQSQRTLAAMTSAMDDAVGRVLQKVRDLGQERNTLVVFISDNGAPGWQNRGRNGNLPLRGGKHTTWEGGIRLPFLMQWPGRLPAGVVSDTPVIQLDVMPTCVAAAGGKVDPAWALDGVDLVPFLTGAAKGRPHQTLYWRIDGMWAVRDGDWKLVHGQAGAEPPELFNLAQDIGEKNNLAAKQPEKVKELQALWDKWNQQQADPDAPKDRAAKKAKRAAKKAR